MKSRLTKPKKHVAAQRVAEAKQRARGPLTYEKVSARYYITSEGEVKYNPGNRGFTRPLSGGPSRTRGS